MTRTYILHSRRLEIKPILDTCQLFLEHAQVAAWKQSSSPSQVWATATSTAAQGLTRPPSTPTSYSSVVVRRLDVGAVGRFVLFLDGRVHALFEDRTIVRMEADEREADVLLATGEELRVRTAKPAGLQG